GLGEGQSDLAADAAGRSGDDDALALEARADIPAHDGPLLASLGWGDLRMLLDEAPLRLAEEFLAVGDQPADMGLGLEGGLGGGDVVEPDLAHPVPARFLRRPALDRPEAQAPDAGKLPHDLGVGAHPMGEEFLVAHARLAPDQADALDHAQLFP